MQTTALFIPNAMSKKIVPLILLLPLWGCGTLPENNVSLTETRVNHVVFCWLREPGNTDHKRRIIERTKAFRYLQGVLDIRVGEAVPSDRKSVDDSFDVGISITFAGIEDLNHYLQHPLHRSAVREVLSPLTKKILVYDFVER